MSLPNRVKGFYTDTYKRECEIRTYWEERARKKNDRIVGEGYAERQIQSTLKLAGKIKTEL